MKKKIKIGIIGFGNIGRKRYEALLKIKNFNIDLEYVVDLQKPKKIKKNITFYNNWKKVLKIKVDLIFLCTPTSESKIIMKRLNGKFNILAEKPLTTNTNDLKKFINKSTKNKKFLKIGYNLRFDEGIMKIKSLIEKKLIGKIYYFKLAYANGAAKTNSNKVGSLLDMGTHSLDLLSWLINNSRFKIVKHLFQKNEFLNQSKTDNGFILLKSRKIHAFIHHGFCTWKNIFNLEISGSKGFLRVNSLSKWKDQRVTLGIRNFPDGKPKIKEWRYKTDNSWKNEIQFLLKNIFKSKNKVKRINLEGLRAINIIKKN